MAADPALHQFRTHMVHMSSQTEQLCKAQDLIVTGDSVLCSSGAAFSYAVVMDGHGTHACIKALRAIQPAQWSAFMAQDDPITAIQQHLTSTDAVPNNPSASSGATCCLVRVFASHLEVLNAGDSQCLVFVNGQIRFLSTEHNCCNELERQRLKIQGRLGYYEPTGDLRMIGSRRLIGVEGQYAVFTNGLRLACTQALGHCNTTGIFPDRTVIAFAPGDTVRCVLGSDGLFDMCEKDVSDAERQELEAINDFSFSNPRSWAVPAPKRPGGASTSTSAIASATARTSVSHSWPPKLDGLAYSSSCSDEDDDDDDGRGADEEKSGRSSPTTIATCAPPSLYLQHYLLSDLAPMGHLSCPEICARAVGRWKQAWDMSNKGRCSTQSLSSRDWDDVAVGVVDIVPRRGYEV